METKNNAATAQHRVMDSIRSYYRSIDKDVVQKHLATFYNSETGKSNISLKINGWERIDTGLIKYLENKGYSVSEVFDEDDDGDDDEGMPIIRRLYYLNVVLKIEL